MEYQASDHPDERGKSEEMNVQFKEDFSKEDSEAHASVQKFKKPCRKNGKRAFLKEGYALIDGLRVDP